MNDLIEKLKDPKQAQPFWMRTAEEQAVLRRAFPSGLLFTNWTHWPSWNATGVSPTVIVEDVYILTPNYQPEPEYMDIPIIIDSSGQLRLKHAEPGRFGAWPIDMCVRYKSFDCFWYEDGPVTTSHVAIHDVPAAMRKHKSVFARFVKE